jgi:ABC-type multidrug transport system ATPase subunit
MMTIEAAGLTKSFGAVTALDGLDLAVAGGSVCALLGPNGAGKTTAVRILATLTRPDAGHASVAGHDVVRRPRQVRASIGLVGQHAAVDDDLTGQETWSSSGSCITSDGGRPSGGPLRCWPSSNWPRPATAWSRRGRAGCAAGWT